MSIPIESQLIVAPCGVLELATSSVGSDCQGVVVVCHPHPVYGGTMDNKVVTTLGRTAFGEGWTVVRFNFRGVGQSEGSFDHGVGELDDLFAVLDWVEHHCQPKRLVLSGFSFGSYIAYMAARVRQVNHLVCVAPPVNHFDFIEPTPEVPSQVIQGDVDEVVPFEQVSSWVEKVGWQSRFTVMQGVSHFFHGHLLPLRDEMRRILSQVQD